MIQKFARDYSASLAAPVIFPKAESVHVFMDVIFPVTQHT